MATISIGTLLKKARIDAGITVKEISDSLVSHGFKASPNTIYSWEGGNSQPTPDALLFMCSKYQISDILPYFGYEKNNADDSSHAMPSEAQRIAVAYEKADPSIQSAIRKLLDVPEGSTEQLKEQIKNAGFTVPKDFGKIAEQANAMAARLNQNIPVKK